MAQAAGSEITAIQKYANLKQDVKMPLLGLGLWRLKEPEMGPVVKQAIRLGYRHFDGAAIYENEADFGKVLKDILSQPEEYRVIRSELFITSKLWNTKHAREDVFESCERTLKDLQLDYLDLYLIHWPFSFESDEKGYSKYDENNVAIIKPVNISETWKAMEELVEQGKVRAIGVSNFTIGHLEQLKKSAMIKPAVNQVEMHPFLPQPGLLQYCQEHGIQVTAYSPLGSGKEPSPLLHPTIQAIAKEERLTPAQVLISWGLSRGTAVIPKTSNLERLGENMKAGLLDAESMRRINEIKEHFRYVNPVDFWKRDCFEDSF